jgi:cation-transporting ATPase E
MSKIIYKSNKDKAQSEDEKASSEIAATKIAEVDTSSDKKNVSTAVKKETEKITEVEESSDDDNEVVGDTYKAKDVDSENFNKDKIIKYFKRHPKSKVSTKVERFTPKLSDGLSTPQVNTRFTQFLFNDTNKKYSRSYASIFISNICTFFNLLCLIAGIALILANTKGITNYLVLFITTLNIAIGIFQEIRSKRAIDRLSILAANTTKVVRDGEVIEIPVNEIVLDDVLFLELGNQVPADCILAEGSVEVNESLLTGESIAIKKMPGDLLYAGSFISSGSGKMRVEKVGKETFIEKLTSKAKKYKRPNSELATSQRLIIKVIAVLIIPIAIGMFFIAKANYDPSSTAEAWIFSKEVNFAIQRTCTVVIGMIPSGMLLLTSTALFLGILRLTKSQTLVQDMYSLEMLAG